MKKFQFVDISGLGNSGKSAAVDFLREFKNVNSPEFSFEFDLFRLPNGILDLHHHLVEDWTLIKSNYAIHEYIKLCKLLAGSKKRRPVFDAFFSAGMGYEARFKGNFLNASEKYIQGFARAQYSTFWPYLLISDSPIVRFYKKLLIKFNFKTSLMTPIILSDGHDFKSLTTEYINFLFSHFFENKSEIITFNNAFEPFNPIRSLNILDNSKIIIIIRDPRDIYVSGLNDHNIKKEDKHLKAFDNNGINKSFLGTDDLSTFITRQKIFFNNLYKGTDPRVKIIRFEDLVLNYDNCSLEIMKFLNLNPSDHINRKKYFDPAKSSKGIGAWKKYSNQDEIEIIYQNLSEYCYDI